MGESGWRSLGRQHISQDLKEDFISSFSESHYYHPWREVTSLTGVLKVTIAGTDGEAQCMHKNINTVFPQ